MLKYNNVAELELDLIQKEYDHLYKKYNLLVINNKQIIEYNEIDELINNINNSNNSNKSGEPNQKFKERKCYPSSSSVYATKELHDLIMNPKFSSYLHCHASHDMSKSFDSRVLVTGLRYFDTHYLDKKITNPILLGELVEIQHTFRSQKKEKIDNFIKKWTVKDRDIKINL
jgi:hypothetical protein